jgi:hypothetical protein
MICLRKGVPCVPGTFGAHNWFLKNFHVPAGMLALLLCRQASAALPDLTFNGPSANPQVLYRTFSSSDCEVVEGCAIPGTRRVLSFTGEIRNLGPGNLVIGDAANNPLFVWAPCHGHYHFNQFAEYRLVDANSRLVTSSRKMAFCLEDTRRWSSTANTSRQFNCGYQGLQAGWADVYDPSVPCQWIDITGLPGGTYTLELVMDPDNLIAEANEGNNVTRVTVTLPADCVSPPNDSFANAQTISGAPASGEGNNGCATKEAGEPNHAGDAGGVSIWFKWTAPSNQLTTITTVGSDFDTLLAVYTGNAVSSLTLVASNDDIVLYSNRQSRLSFQAVAGTVYRIAVDGWHAENGRVLVNINPPPNDAFAACLAISDVKGTVAGYNIGAVKEPNELAHVGNIGGHSVWFCWTPPVTDSYVFDTTGSDFDTLLAIYTGSTVANIVSVAGNDNFGTNNTSMVRFNGAAGTNYKIALDGFSGATGRYVLNWAPFRRPSLSIRSIATNRCEITVRGNAGAYELQGGNNLTNWATRTTFSLTGPPFVYAETANGSFQFYRVILR